VGLGFLAAKIGLQYVANKKLKEGNKHNKKVVAPIAGAIAKRVKILGPLDKVNTAAVDNFKEAVRTLITKLDAQGLNVQQIVGTMDDPVQRDALLNEIAMQTKLHLVGKRSGCAFFSNVCKAETSPGDLRGKVNEIAKKVAAMHKGRYGVAMAMLGGGVVAA
jgi:hypothetical protein